VKITYLVLLNILIFPVVKAEVITDGSLGAKAELPGKDFQITPELGQQFGGNLFHSFQQFNLSEGESATFSGANSVQNIITRVTGGSPSMIDGTLRSTIPNADLYFLNPYGVMFGQHAKLDLQGGFHVSTADYLRLADGGRFEARNLSNSLLTVAPVTAFGFLTDSPAPIKTRSSQLAVLPEQTLSLIGGDIHLSNETPLTIDNTSMLPEVTTKSILATEHGRVNLASLASRGEVIPSENDLILEGTGGNITVENTLIELSGHGGSAIFIRAGQFVLDNALIRSNTFGNQDGKDINVKATESAYLKGVNSEISVATASANHAGGILIDAPLLEIIGASINAGSSAEGDAGTITIHAKQASLKDGGLVGSAAFGSGRSGDILLDITEKFSILGFAPGHRDLHGLTAENSQSFVHTSSLGSGASGNIKITTQALIIEIGSIGTDSYGSGLGGEISIDAQSVRLDLGAIISSTTFDTAKAGDIHFRVTEQMEVTGEMPINIRPFAGNMLGKGTRSTIVSGSGLGSSNDGGMIAIDANRLILKYGRIATNSVGLNKTTGDAGNIVIHAKVLRLTDGGLIEAKSDSTSGGNIYLTTTNLLYSQRGQIATSVKGGIGHGGNITLNHPNFIVLNHGQIKAEADAGHGGNIAIAAEHFVKSVESLVSASSNLGVDGQITIDSPTEDIGSQVLNLSANFLNAASLFPRSCAARIADQRPSQFVRPFTLIVKPKTVIAAPEDTRASPYPTTLYYKWFDQYR